MEKGKIAYLILKNLYDGNILSEQELELNKKEYAEILRNMQNEGLIQGVRIANLGQEGLAVKNQNAAITISGINYLMENTIPDREYKMQVSVDEILDGIELSTSVDVNGKIRRYKKILHRPLTDIDIEAESFSLIAEGLKKDKVK